MEPCHADVTLTHFTGLNIAVIEKVLFSIIIKHAFSCKLSLDFLFEDLVALVLPVDLLHTEVFATIMLSSQV